MSIAETLQRYIDTSPRLCSTDVQLLMRDLYETTYKIFDHAHPHADHPLSLVLMHWNEDSITQGPLHERMNQYIDADIHKYFHFNFQEWIEQSSWMCNLQLEIARNRIKKEAPVIQAALDQMNAAGKS